MYEIYVYILVKLILNGQKIRENFPWAHYNFFIIGDYLDPNDGSRPPSRQFVEAEATAKSRKKWFAIGLCMCLILVLLIAVIVLASTKVTPPPCPKPNTNTTGSFPGSNDHLKSNEPSLGPSRTEGVAGYF